MYRWSAWFNFSANRYKGWTLGISDQASGLSETPEIVVADVIAIFEATVSKSVPL
jgi:hypothetical protein